MNEQRTESQSQGPAVSRREFLKQTSLAAATAAATLGFPSVVRAQARPTLNAVIIGYGGRGSGAGNDFLEAAKIVGVEARIVAVADIFPEQARRAQQQHGVPENRCFSGFDAYLKALEQPGVNYAILAEPPGFRPSHFKACIQRGVHVFMEKPVAVDAPGCRIMYDMGEEARRKGLKVAAGTQRRHQASYLETIRRIWDGVIGEVTALRAYWVNGGPIWHRGDHGATDLERQIRNWYHYIWLCGDHIVEQHVHNIDVCNWIMKDHPVRAWGMGARQQLGDKSGEIWDNFAVEFEYRNGVRMHSYCGQIRRSWASVSEAVVGTKGTADPSGMIRVHGQRPERIRPEGRNPYVQEHVDLIEAIVKDTELNETKNVTDSTLTAIMGREAAYSGSQVEWDTILKSEFKYGPELVYEESAKLTWGPFRTLRPPMPSIHDIFKNPPSVPTV